MTRAFFVCALFMRPCRHYLPAYTPTTLARAVPRAAVVPAAPRQGHQRHTRLLQWLRPQTDHLAPHSGTQRVQVRLRPPQGTRENYGLSMCLHATQGGGVRSLSSVHQGVPSLGFSPRSSQAIHVHIAGLGEGA
jgi:hypothetical protein